MNHKGHAAQFRIGPALGTFFLFLLPSAARPDELALVSTDPPSQALEAPVDVAVSIRFDRAVDRDSVFAPGAFGVFGRWSGAAVGSIEFSDEDRVVRLVPSHPFSYGEMVMVALSRNLQAADGSPFRSSGYGYQFWINSRTADLDYVIIDTLSTRTIPTESTTPYGGIASDLNHDRFLDLTIVNEDTGDLRVFLNKADRSGLHDDFIQPPFEVNLRASPSEPADFNGDGHTDICVANINTDTVSVLLGAGDGTYGPQQEIAAGGDPRGIAVLDAEGDGDIDFVNTNATTSNLSIFFNDGQGVFGPATFFESGASGEWALGAADMNEDGLFDLVIGAQSSQQIVIMGANGDGTFTTLSTQSAGGLVWMLGCGDINGDGHVDVGAANSTTNRGAILLGDGLGGLGAPVSYVTDSFPLATDFGDLDGDGDLDWITSSFFGDWRIFINDGRGTFTFLKEINAVQAASCSLLYDSDNDGDLDLALIDELSDTVSLAKNGDTQPLLGDGDNDCHADLQDYALFQACLSGPDICADSGCNTFDFDDDCDVDLRDFAAFQRAFTGPETTLPGCGN